MILSLKLLFIEFMNASSHLWVHSSLVNVTFFPTHYGEQSQGNSPREILNKWSKISQVRVRKESKAVDFWSKVKIMKNSPIGRRFILKKRHFESKMFWKLWSRLWYRHLVISISFAFIENPDLTGHLSLMRLHPLHFQFIQFSCSVMSDSLWPHGLQHTRLPCPSPTPGACSNSCPLSWWWHPTISFSVVPFSSCLQSFLASGSFSMS